MLWIGVDIGGTFTDVIAYDPDHRRLRAAKTLSTPDSPVQAVMDGLRKLQADFAEIDRFVHGTTRVTNALLENAGVPVALITTEGFRDVIEMGRGHRRRLYHMKEQAPRRLVARPLRFEVAERVLADGTIRQPLDEAQVLAILKEIAARKVAGVAICLLHSYRNPEHENRIARLAAKHHPALAISTSAEVVPEIGEYERFATTVQNVSVKPIVDAYLAELQSALAGRGYPGQLSIMTSGGGVVSADEARRVPMQLALSGPAGGVAACVYLSVRAGFPNVITCDVGGTSADVCLIKGGQPTMTNQSEIAGFPNKALQVEIQTIGAGGGSIAWVDVGGELCIGPQSAGAKPGPACYGRGGTQPTTTDAHLIVGHLDSRELLGGEVLPDMAAARRAMEALAGKLGIATPEDLALGIIRLAVAKMTSAIKEISIARGHDPRDFALLPFGGAGPMHATLLADELGMDTIFIPPVPGNLSALGFVTAQTRHDLVRMVMAPLGTEGLKAVAAAFEDLSKSARASLANADFGTPGEASLQFSIGMRIKGQTFELQVPVAGTPASPEELGEKFRTVYQERYAYLPAQTGLEIVSCRVTAIGARPEVVMEGSGELPSKPPAQKPIYTQRGWVQALVRQRDGLAPGETFAGPAIIQESGATTVVGAGWQVSTDAFRNLVIRRAA